MQGVIKSYDPATGDGSLLSEVDLSEYVLSPDALECAIFRMLRHGQRVKFELNADGMSTDLRFGYDVDLGTPDFAGHAEPAPERD